MAANQEARNRQFWQDLAKLVPKVVEGSTKIAINQLNTEMQDRIFNQSLATDGSKLKNGQGYSESYAKFRKKKGRQTQRIDLQLTGALRQSITEIKSTVGQAIIFNQDRQAEIAQYIGENFDQTIFEPSETEAERALDLVEEVFTKSIDELNRQYTT